MKIGVILIVLFFIGFWSGWVMNLYKLSNCDFEEPYKTEALRVVGIVPPIGAVIGWMDIGEEN